MSGRAQPRRATATSRWVGDPPSLWEHVHQAWPTRRRPVQCPPGRPTHSSHPGPVLGFCIIVESLLVPFALDMQGLVEFHKVFLQTACGIGSIARQPGETPGSELRFRRNVV